MLPQLNVGCSISELSQEIPELRLGNDAIVDHIDLVEKVVQVELAVIELQIHFLESLVHELLDLSLVDVSVVVEVVSFPDVVDPLVDVLDVCAHTVLANVVGVSFLFVRDLSEAKTHHCD